MMGITFKLKRGRSNEWVEKDPVLRSGEPGFETDTIRIKLGDGISRWTDLPYFLNEEDVLELLQNASVHNHSGVYASFEQGVLAESAVQPEDLDGLGGISLPDLGDTTVTIEPNVDLDHPTYYYAGPGAFVAYESVNVTIERDVVIYHPQASVDAEVYFYILSDDGQTGLVQWGSPAQVATIRLAPGSYWLAYMHWGPFNGSVVDIAPLKRMKAAFESDSQPVYVLAGQADGSLVPILIDAYPTGSLQAGSGHSVASNGLAVGRDNVNTGSNNATVGRYNSAHTESIAVGYNNQTRGSRSATFGADNVVNHSYSTAIGRYGESRDSGGLAVSASPAGQKWLCFKEGSSVTNRILDVMLPTHNGVHYIEAIVTGRQASSALGNQVSMWRVVCAIQRVGSAHQLIVPITTVRLSDPSLAPNHNVVATLHTGFSGEPNLRLTCTGTGSGATTNWNVAYETTESARRDA